MTPFIGQIAHKIKRVSKKYKFDTVFSNRNKTNLYFDVKINVKIKMRLMLNLMLFIKSLALIAIRFISDLQVDM